MELKIITNQDIDIFEEYVNKFISQEQIIVEESRITFKELKTSDSGTIWKAFILYKPRHKMTTI